MTGKKISLKDRIRKKITEQHTALIGDNIAHADEAELELIALVMGDAANGFFTFDLARQSIAAHMFREDVPRNLWRAIDAEMEATQQLTPALILSRLRKLGISDEGMEAELFALSALEVDADASVLAQRIADAHGRREYQLASSRVAQEGATMELADMERTLDDARDQLRAAQGCAYRTTGEEIAGTYLSMLAGLSSSPDAKVYQFGLGLDNLLAVETGGNYHVVGPKKSGKTTVALAIIANMMKTHGAIIDIWTVEQGERQMQHALISALTGLSRKQLGLGHMVHRDFLHSADIAEKMADALALIRSCDVSINCTSAASVSDIAAYTNVRHAQHRKAIAAGVPHLFVVDYLQGLPTHGERDPWKGISRNSQQLREIVKTQRIRGIPRPIGLILAHTKQGIALPTDDDVYGSAQPSKDTDGMVAISAPGKGRDGGKWDSHLDMNLCLNRNDGVATWGMNIDHEHIHLSEWEGETWREAEEFRQSRDARKKGAYRGY